MRAGVADSVGEFIREERERRDISQRQLAKLIGNDVGYLNRIEHGRILPSAACVGKLAHALQLSKEDTDALFYLADKLPPRLAENSRRGFQRSRMEALHDEHRPAGAVPAAAVVADLYDATSGMPDLGRIADYLGVSFEELSTSFGASAQASRGITAGESGGELSAIARTIETLAEMVGRRDAEAVGRRMVVRAWLNSPQPALGMRTSMQEVLAGHADVVTSLLEGALSGSLS